jgi:hypothetical protein
MSGGRPSNFDKSVGDKICERLVEGESLRSICRDPDMPAISTVFGWFRIHPEFKEQYAQAKDEQCDTYADDIVAIADRYGVSDDDTAVMTARDRLRIDARKWVAAKLKPKRYGDRIAQEITGGDGGPVDVITRVEVVGVKPNGED